MANKKVKVWNRTKGVHTFVFSDGIRQFPIAPGGFQLIPIEEIYFVNSMSKSFKKGILEIDPDETELLQELGYEIKSPNTYSEKELENLLKGNFTKRVKEKLSNITELHAKRNLIETARKLDLSQSKVKTIEEITDMKVYDELLDDDKKESKKTGKK